MASLRPMLFIPKGTLRYDKETKKVYMDVLVEEQDLVFCKNCMYSYFADNRVPDEQALVCERGGCSVTPDGFCAWGTPETTCGPDYCEIGGVDDAR